MAAYPHFTVTTQQVSITVNAGETFSISVTVTNDEEASRTVELRLKDHNNNVVDSLSLTLDARHSASATLFGVAPNTKGIYQWTVEAFTLTVEVHPTPIYGEGITTEIIVVVVVVIVAIAGIGVLIAKRRR